MNNIDELVNKLMLKIKEDIVEGNPQDLINLLLNHIPVNYIQMYLAKKDNEEV